MRRFWYANIYYWEIKCFIIVIVKKIYVLYLEPGNIENTDSSLEDYDFFMITGELNNCNCKTINILLVLFLETWKSWGDRQLQCTGSRWFGFVGCQEPQVCHHT